MSLGDRNHRDLCHKCGLLGIKDHSTEHGVTTLLSRGGMLGSGLTPAGCLSASMQREQSVSSGCDRKLGRAIRFKHLVNDFASCISER